MRGNWNHLHDDEDRAYDDTLCTATQNWVRYDGECLVYDHVREEERHQQEMAILANRLDLVGIPLLVTGNVRSLPSVPRSRRLVIVAHGVPLMLSTFS